MSVGGHSLQVHSAPVLTNVWYAPKATASRRKATRRYGPILLQKSFEFCDEQ
jgi:hypothetical protein